MSWIPCIICIWIVITELCSGIICTSGDCAFDCSKQNCKEIVCTDTADSCSIHCDDSNCYESMFYLSANVNTVICDGSDSCKSAQFHCGIPDIIPFGFSETHFDAHINSCVFTLTNNAMSDSGLISCSHDIDFCLVETQSDNDDFKESTFQCKLSPLHSRCILKCYNDKSCGSMTSSFICDAANCQCMDYDHHSCDAYLNITPILHSPPETTINPTPDPIDKSISSTDKESISPTMTPTVSSKVNNKIIAFSPTHPPTEQVYVFSTLIRKERPIQSEVKRNDTVNDSDPINGYTVSSWTKIGGGMFCVMVIFCSCSVMAWRKVYQERKRLKVKEQSKTTEDHKASTIDLTDICIETNMSDAKGEPVFQVELDDTGVLYDIDLDETSDDETLNSASNAVYHKNADSVVADKLDADNGYLTSVTSWNTNDDELEDMYNLDGNGYSKTTPFLPQSIDENSVICTPPQSSISYDCIDSSAVN